MQMIKLFDKIEERENKVFAFIPGLKSEVFPLTHIRNSGTMSSNLQVSLHSCCTLRQICPLKNCICPDRLSRYHHLCKCDILPGLKSEAS